MSKKKEKLTKSQKKRIIVGTLVNAAALGAASYMIGPIFGSSFRAIKAGIKSPTRKYRIAKRAYLLKKNKPITKIKPKYTFSYRHKSPNIINFKPPNLKKRILRSLRYKRDVLRHKRKSKIDDIFDNPDFHIIFMHNMDFFEPGIIPTVKRPLRKKEALAMTALGGYFGYKHNKPKKRKK